MIATSIPPRAGVGLKLEHYAAIVAERPDIGWFEVHPENYMGAGGPPHHMLSRIRRDYPLSLHGVGLSIGSAGPLDRDHLARIAALVSRYEPGLFSEHLAWSSHETAYLNDLLPLPYTAETLSLVVSHVDEVQEALDARICIENPSTYVRFADDEMSEIDFLASLARRTGCGLLLDVNNVCVSAANHGFDPNTYVDGFPVEHVGEIHLAGHARLPADDPAAPLLVDTHDRAVHAEVWALYERFVKRAGARPTLVEWDNDIPAWSVLFGEAQAAESILDGC
ncbi:MAG: DUF692 domain-containing protein [Aestuariivirgaceae bacterium]